MEGKAVKLYTKSIWIPFNGYSLYEISPLGIRNKNNKYVKKVRPDKGDYAITTLTGDDGKSHPITIHIQIAKHFIPNPNNLPIVNHLDGNRMNFHPSNLEWASYRRNNLHMYENGRAGQLMSGVPIEQIDLEGTVIAEFPSISQTADKLGISIGKINWILQCDKRVNGLYFRRKIQKNLPGELWEPTNTGIKELDNTYEVSNMGRVKQKIKENILSQSIQNKYYRVALTLNGKSVGYRVNILVAVVFCENKFGEDAQVDHINKNKLDNRAFNLKFLPRKEHLIKDHGKPLRCIHPDGTITLYRSRSEAAEKLGIPLARYISTSIKQGFKCMGCKFEYIEDPLLAKFIKMILTEI